MAGVEGVEPSHTAPETAVLPLDDTPVICALLRRELVYYGLPSVSSRTFATFLKNLFFGVFNREVQMRTQRLGGVFDFAFDDCGKQSIEGSADFRTMKISQVCNLFARQCELFRAERLSAAFERIEHGEFFIDLFFARVSLGPCPLAPAALEQERPSRAGYIAA